MVEGDDDRRRGKVAVPAHPLPAVTDCIHCGIPGGIFSRSNQSRLRQSAWQEQVQPRNRPGKIGRIVNTDVRVSADSVLINRP